MKGSYTIRVENNKLRYEFTIRRNITIRKGDSATGKTTLVEMIREHYEDRELSGVTIQSEVQCRTLAGRDWSVILPTIKNSIIFIDEENTIVKSDDFARKIQESVTRYLIPSW